MMHILLAGLGAGVAAALLFASMASGVPLSLFLAFLAPLPIMIVALGWSHWAALMATATAAAILGAVFGAELAAVFLIFGGVPAWWLGYLALLGRPRANGGAAQMEWYPPGRLYLWATLSGAAVTAAALVAFWGDDTAMRQSLKSNLDLIMGPDAPQLPAELSGIDPDLLVEMMVRVLPPAVAVTVGLIQIADLWLAGQVVRLSGRLQRPWPDLSAVSFPLLAAALYGATLAGAFLPGVAGIIGGLFAATLTFAFAMVGFAVVHTLTRGMQGRT
ncbi:MAG: DUF2232 domain-containing protein, partial [Bradyrhizobiaceae bacterium]|nr:DUF2232 domain-containing protein [Bradyrhizobiaceae bacterium]